MLEELKSVRDWFREEGRVIRQAPGSFAIGLIFIGALIFGVLEWHHSGTEEALRATVSSLQSQNDMLREELKGASPQLAALHARRAQMRSKLLSFYVEAGELARRAIPFPAKDGGFDKDAIGQWDKDEKEWEERTKAWINENLGGAASERFVSWSGSPNYAWKGGDYDPIRNRIEDKRRNLALIIESSAYDK